MRECFNVEMCECLNVEMFERWKVAFLFELKNAQTA